MPKICPICERSYSDDNAFCPADGTTLRADVTGDLIGSVIADRYLITDLLGEGGMGRVYLGRHVRLPQQAAIKVLRQDLVQDNASIARFNREATSASRIQSEYVARVFDFGETSEGLVYLAMEFVPGRTLRSLVQAEGPLLLPRTAAIISQIAEGLDAAHRLGIVHRDLKPDNVIVAHDEETGDRAKVVDFGIAKAVGSEKEGQITSTGFVVGTPDYMSPEQLLNEPVDARSDVYALGLVAYNMLTAALPFESSTPSKGLMARLVDKPAPLSQSNPHGMWSLHVQQVFDTVLSREVDKRYSTAREFAHALREAAGLAAPLVGAGAMGGTAVNAGAGAAARRTSTQSATAATGKGGASTATGSTTESAPVATTPQSRKLVLIAAGVFATATIVVAGIVIGKGGLGGGDASTVAPPPPMVAADAPDTSNSSGMQAPTSADSAIRTTATLDDPQPAAPGRPVATNAGAAAGTGSANDNASATNAGSPLVTTPPTRPAASIRASIDSVRLAVDELLFAVGETGVPAKARAQVQRIATLLPRGNSAADSARLYLLSANASKLAGDDKVACTTLDLAKKVARTDVDRRATDRAFGEWGCDSPWR